MKSEYLKIPLASKVKAVTLRLHPGEDLKQTLDEWVAAHQIKAACIITCLGSLQQAAIRFANLPAADILPGKFEIISLTGTLAQAGSHLHIAISDGTGKITGGHLQSGCVVYTTAEIIIGILPDVVFKREVDNTYGFKELLVKKA